MTTFNVTGDFAAAPLGAFTKENKQKVWAGAVTQDFDASGQRYSIIDDPRLGGRCCRMLYGAGKYGMNDQSYGIRIPSPKCPIALEFDWLFEDGFQFYDMALNPANGGGGKIGPCINWGEIGGETSKRGTRGMWWWNAYGSNKPHPCFAPSCQDQRTGNQLIQPTKYTPRLELEHVYHFKIELQGGSADRAYAKYWQDGILIAEVKGKEMLATNDDDVIIDFAFFSGGMAESAPNHDCYARHGNIRYYSVASAPPIPEPVPPEPVEVAPFSIAVGEKKVFRARFFDTGVYPPQEIPAGAAVKWSLGPNLVTWGPEAGPNWSAIQVTGKTVGGPCVLIATDPSTGISTKPVNVDVTETPRTPGPDMGICTVEPLVGAQRGAGGTFSDKPPQ